MTGLIVLQARLSSTRLAGKVLMPIYNGKSILDIQFDKLTSLGLPIVLATTINKVDDALSDWAKEKGIDCFRGSELNVLERFVECAESKKAQHIVRVCSDNPFLQVNDIEKYLEALLEGVDYISYADRTGVPAVRKHWGLFVEGVSLSALQTAISMLKEHAEAKFYQEHVTNYIYGHPKEFRLRLNAAPNEVIDREDLRFTVDTPEDFKNMQQLLQLIEADYEISLMDLVKTVDEHPEIREIMMSGIATFSK